MASVREDQSESMSNVLTVITDAFSDQTLTPAGFLVMSSADTGASDKIYRDVQSISGVSTAFTF